MTAELENIVFVLRARLRAAEQAAVVEDLYERVIVNCDTNQFDQALGRAVAKLRKAERDLVTAIHNQGGQA